MKLFESSAGALILVSKDTAHNVTRVQSQSCFREDAEGLKEGRWGAGDPGPVYDRVGEMQFQKRDEDQVVLDLSGWKHVATWSEGAVKRHKEGGLAARQYLREG